MKGFQSSTGSFSWLAACLVAFAAVSGTAAMAQATSGEPPVLVTLQGDVARLAPGGTSVVRAFARIAPAFRTVADRIFSWNVDLLVLNREVAVVEPATLVRPRSDQDPILGSTGIVDGVQIRGIRDSFLELEGAGVGEAVELFSVTLRAIAPGVCTLRLRAGTLGVEAGPDFLVLPLGDEDAWSGADYSGATWTIEVAGGTVTPPRLRVAPGVNGSLKIEVEGDAGSTVGLEESDDIGIGAAWRRAAQGLAGAAVLTLDVTPSAPRRFYRGVRLP